MVAELKFINSNPGGGILSLPHCTDGIVEGYVEFMGISWGLHRSVLFCAPHVVLDMLRWACFETSARGPQYSRNGTSSNSLGCC